MWYKMKRKHSGYILASLFLSLCSHIVLVVSVMTESWVVAEASPVSTSANTTYINYGLYQGTLVQEVNNRKDKFVLTITCMFYLNSCAWTCQTWDSLRREEILALYDTGKVLYTCPDVANTVVVTRPLSQVREAFMDGAAWLATVVAVVLSGIVSLVALLLTAYNINHIPSNPWVSIRGLYFWFGASSILALLAVTVWGAEFILKLSVNVGYIDTIAGLLNSDDKAYLGYSFWCQLVVIGLQSCCVLLLLYRDSLFDRRPPFVCPLRIPQHTINVSYFS